MSNFSAVTYSRYMFFFSLLLLGYVQCRNLLFTVIFILPFQNTPIVHTDKENNLILGKNYEIICLLATHKKGKIHYKRGGVGMTETGEGT